MPRQRRITRLFGFACMFGLLLLPAACSTAPEEPTADGRLAFCLASDQRDRLTNAAVAIGRAQKAPGADRIVVDGANLSVDEWRARYGADFDRACDALISAARVPSVAGSNDSSAASGLFSDLRSVLLLVAGAVVSLLSGSVKYGIDRRRSQASQLSSAGQRFRRTYQDYRDERRRGSQPDLGPVREQRQNLEALLRDVRDLHPTMRPAQDAADVLADALGIDRLTTDSRRDPAAQAGTASPVDDALRELDDHVAGTVRRLRRPVLGRWGRSS